MAKLVLAGGPSYDIRPLTLSDLIAVGEHMDAVNDFLSDDQARHKPTARFAVAKNQLTVFAAGISGVTVDALVAQTSAADLDNLWSTYVEVQKEAGMIKDPKPGEAEPAAAPAGESP